MPLKNVFLLHSKPSYNAVSAYRAIRIPYLTVQTSLTRTAFYGNRLQLCLEIVMSTNHIICTVFYKDQDKIKRKLFVFNSRVYIQIDEKIVQKLN